MDLCLVSNGTLNETWQEKLDVLSGQNVVVFGFNGLGLVSYKKELAGETEYFHDVAKLSRQLSSVVICGCDTDTYGVFRHSAVIADKGKVLGVTDMVHSVDDSEFVSGGSYRVYQTSAGKIGVVISEDLYFFDTAKIMSVSDAELVVCIFKKLDGYMPQTVLRASSFIGGMAMALVSKNYACVSDIRGKIIASGSAEYLKTKVKIEKDYRLVTTKRRGLFKDDNGDY